MKKQAFTFKKTFLIAMIISLSVSAMIGIGIFLFGNFGDMEAKLLITTLAIGGYSLSGLCCSLLYEKKIFTPFALSGMVISIIGFLYTLLVIWKAIDLSNQLPWKVLVLFIIFATSIAHACLLLHIKSKKVFVNSALSATIIFILIVAFMLSALILNENKNMGEFYFRLLGVFAILDVLGTIVTPILNKVYSIEQ